MGDPKEDLGHDYVQSLDRGLAVIRCFSAQRPALTLTEVAQLTSLTRATARRLLRTLEALGYVSVTGRTFTLTPHVLELGYSYLSSLGIGELAEQPIRDLVAAVDETSSVAVLDGDDIVYVLRVPANRLMTVWAGVGTRLPAYPTSLGRVLLAGFDDHCLDECLKRLTLHPHTRHTITDKGKLRAVIEQARVQGWTMVDQEYEIGVRSVAAPLKNRHGTTIAALNVSAQAGRVSITDLRRRILPLVTEAAAEISRRLTHS